MIIINQQIIILLKGKTINGICQTGVENNGYNGICLSVLFNIYFLIF
jgi:hypothetical protein